MARPEVTGQCDPASQTENVPPKKKKKSEPVVLVANAAAYSIPEFCEAHRISESMYYKIRAHGQGPRETHALTKVIITKESAAEWRRDRTTSATEADISAKEVA